MLLLWQRLLIALFPFDHYQQQIDAKTVKDVCSKYIYDQCPVVVGLGIACQ